MNTRSAHSIVFSVVLMAPLIAHTMPLPMPPIPEPLPSADREELYLFSVLQPRENPIDVDRFAVHDVLIAAPLTSL